MVDMTPYATIQFARGSGIIGIFFTPGDGSNTIYPCCKTKIAYNFVQIVTSCRNTLHAEAMDQSGQNGEDCDCDFLSNYFYSSAVFGGEFMLKSLEVPHVRSEGRWQRQGATGQVGKIHHLKRQGDLVS